MDSKFFMMMNKLLSTLVTVAQLPPPLAGENTVYYTKLYVLRQMIEKSVMEESDYL